MPLLLPSAVFGDHPSLNDHLYMPKQWKLLSETICYVWVAHLQLRTLHTYTLFRLGDVAYGLTVDWRCDRLGISLSVEPQKENKKQKIWKMCSHRRWADDAHDICKPKPNKNCYWHLFSHFIPKPFRSEYCFFVVVWIAYVLITDWTISLLHIVGCFFLFSFLNGCRLEQNDEKHIFSFWAIPWSRFFSSHKIRVDGFVWKVCALHFDIDICEHQPHISPERYYSRDMTGTSTLSIYIYIYRHTSEPLTTASAWFMG